MKRLKRLKSDKRITPPRILAGRWRNRPLKIAPEHQFRPTLERHRIRLFDWLAPILPQARVLDLFAGSGALGFEALSRGAQYAELVEADWQQAAQLKAFKEAVAADASILTMDAFQYANLFSKSALAFNLIFLDPPFSKADALPPFIEALLNASAHPQSLWIYCELPSSSVALTLSNRLALFREKVFKNVILRLYRCER